MPHIILKIAAGQTEATKQILAAEFTNVITKYTQNSSEAVSVGIEEVAAEQWEEKVYNVDIAPKLKKLYKKPGYSFNK